jgi:hypothetical protein
MLGSRPGDRRPSMRGRLSPRAAARLRKGRWFGKDLGGDGLTLFISRVLLQRAKAERREETDGEPYVCPIPQDVRP